MLGVFTLPAEQGSSVRTYPHDFGAESKKVMLLTFEMVLLCFCQFVGDKFLSLSINSSEFWAHYWVPNNSGSFLTTFRFRPQISSSTGLREVPGPQPRSLCLLHVWDFPWNGYRLVSTTEALCTVCSIFVVLPSPIESLKQIGNRFLLNPCEVRSLLNTTQMKSACTFICTAHRPTTPRHVQRFKANGFRL
jgi:hypothetical protein